MTNEQHMQLMQCLRDLESDLDARIAELERKEKEASRLFEAVYRNIKRLFDND